MLDNPIDNSPEPPATTHQQDDIERNTPTFIQCRSFPSSSSSSSSKSSNSSQSQQVSHPMRLSKRKTRASSPRHRRRSLTKFSRTNPMSPLSLKCSFHRRRRRHRYHHRHRRLNRRYERRSPVRYHRNARYLNRRVNTSTMPTRINTMSITLPINLRLVGH